MKASSIAVNNIAKKKHIDCKEQGTKERPLGKSKSSAKEVFKLMNFHPKNNLSIYVRRSKTKKSQAFNANIMFETIQTDAFVNRIKGEKPWQQGACVAVHGNEKDIFHSGHSSFSGIESP